MKIIFTLVLLCLGIPLVPVTIRAYNKHEKIWTLLSYMMMVVIEMDITYLLAILLPNDTASHFFFGVYHVSYLWLIYTFSHFAFYYSESRKIPHVLRGLVIAFSIVDLVLLSAVNARYHNAITFTEEVYPDGMTYRILNFDSTLYRIHMWFSICIAAFAFVMITIRFFTTASLYRRRYGVLLVMFAVMVGIYALTIPYDLPLHLIIIPFNILCFSLYYAIGHYIPRDLMYHIMSYAASSLEEGIVCFDQHNNMIYANTRARDALRFTGVTNIDEYFAKLNDEQGLHDTEAARWSDTVTDGDETRYFEYRFQRLRDDAGTLIGCYYTALDRTAEQNAFETERIRATHDPLTGLYNTEGFIERVTEVLRADMDTPRYMLASDIKDFKLVNDLFGDEKGNEILVRISDLLKQKSAEDTVCGRLTSDQFVMLIRQDQFKETDIINGIDEISTLIRSTVYKLCLHIGVFAIDDPMMSVSLMFDRARMAIATVKNESRSQIVYFSPDILRSFMDERRVIAELEQAVKKQELQIYLQPQIDAEGDVTGAEALARWNHPSKGVLLPGEFIPILEQAGLIHQLDLAIWEMACKQLQAWKNTDKKDLYISVNISARDFFYIDVYGAITNLADQYGVDPKKLHLEITESALIGEPEKQQTLINRLRSYGFEVEIDDFGSGYSSLSMLKDFPVDTLKLDLAFLRETENKMRARVILASVVSLTNLLGMQVIAEGVEDESQLDYLKTLGCSRFQGYFFSRPVPVDDFEAYFNARRS